MADLRGMDIRQALEQGLMDMANLIIRGDYNLALVKGRQVMEQLIRSYAKENRIIYTDLADTIEDLYGENTIGRGSRDAFHTIRQLGNKAVHEGNNDPKDAEDSYYLLRNEIEVYLNTNAGTKNRTPVNISRRNSSASAYNDETVDVSFARATAKKVEGDIDTYRAPIYDQTSGRKVEPKRDSSSSSDVLKTEPVKRTTKSQSSGSGSKKTKKPSSRQSASSNTGKRSKVPTREDRLRANRQEKRRGTRNRGVDIYSVLRILVPVICVILLIVLIRSFMGASETEETTTTTQVETSTVTPETTEAATEPETTTEAAPLSYVVTGDNVNAR